MLENVYSDIRFNNDQRVGRFVANNEDKEWGEGAASFSPFFPLSSASISQSYSSSAIYSRLLPTTITRHHPVICLADNLHPVPLETFFVQSVLEAAGVGELEWMA